MKPQVSKQRFEDALEAQKHVAFLIETAHAAGQYTTVMRDVLLAIAIVYVVVECPGVSRPVSLCIAKLARFLTMPLS
jgi:hypothetical protein